MEADINGEAAGENFKECTICLSVDSDSIIMPCGHMCVCMPCGKSIQKSKNNNCPICRS